PPRYLTSFAADLLVARARAGVLDPRVGDALRPLLGRTEQPAIVDILGALRDRDSVPAMVALLDRPEAPLATASARALRAIGDPSAVPALSAVVRRDSGVRVVAADALATCLAAAPEPRDVDDNVIAALLEHIASERDDQDSATLQLVYGRIAQL